VYSTYTVIPIAFELKIQYDKTKKKKKDLVKGIRTFEAKKMSYRNIVKQVKQMGHNVSAAISCGLYSTWLRC
jgi:hypothetical protein